MKSRRQSLIQGLELYVQINHPNDKVKIMEFIVAHGVLNLQTLFVIQGKLSQELNENGILSREEWKRPMNKAVAAPTPLLPIPKNDSGISSPPDMANPFQPQAPTTWDLAENRGESFEENTTPADDREETKSVQRKQPLRRQRQWKVAMSELKKWL